MQQLHREVGFFKYVTDYLRIHWQECTSTVDLFVRTIAVDRGVEGAIAYQALEAASVVALRVRRVRCG